MKTNLIKIRSKIFSALYLTSTLLSIFFISGCDNDDPVKEDVPELITKATLTFTPISGSTIEVKVTATDPDGEGVQSLRVDSPINLLGNQSYTLEITLVNELSQTNAGYFISEEVAEEADEHMFFFSWTNNVFGDPTGNGNMDNRSDAVNYEDEDVNGLPLGLKTSWTSASTSTGDFRVVLKHQPGLKSASSDSNTGETDLDITFVINIH